ncbi:MAG: hypothetical protein C0501_26895 [Isosphaera sp.]|nr:hypothetical protein [Isosphaera sp.]
MLNASFDATVYDEVPMPVISRRDFLAASAAGVAAAARGQAPKPEAPVPVPARAVTKGPKHHWFGYYDKTPWDATGRYLLAHESAFAARQPTAEDKTAVGMVDLKDGDRFVELATTPAWGWQQGAMLQWLGTPGGTEVIFNDLVDGKPAARILDTATKKSRTLPLPIYSVTADGKRAVTPDFARTHRLRPGYGYASYPETLADDPAPEKLGIWHMDLTTGKHDLILSLKQIAANKPDDRFTNCHHGVEHLVWNPGGTRFVFLHRWRAGDKPWLTRVYTAKPDGTDLRLHLDTGMASHFDWRDDHTLLFWAKHPKAGNKFFTIDTRSDETQLVGDGVLTQDGHCSYSPDRKWILNDTYPDKERMQTLMLFKVATGRRYDLNRFHSPKAFTGPVRCDLHPRWNRDGTQVCIDGCHDPQRQVYVLDVAEVVKS